jgi:AraC family transcriptional regulator, regulatory protein of adaptative response / DNA-3-methyladenine glycosylase II
LFSRLATNVSGAAELSPSERVRKWPDHRTDFWHIVDMSIETDCPLDLDHDACYRALATRDRRFDGRIFIGVHTTGIYCRPICPARTPKRENVSFFPTASAAQEAGFRPCLRCRPESSPDLGAWRGTSNTVSRALTLIGDGVLDGEAVDALARRLGVGERHLRRLFKQHLGASPIAVAQTRRVLFAKQLIVETTMPLAEIALASGFGSVRRFNATFQALYNRAPRDLRRCRGTINERTAAVGITLTLPYAPPYDWDAMVQFLGARAIAGIEVVEENKVYRRSIALDGAQGVFAVEPADDRCGLKVTIRFPRVDYLAAIVERVRRVFDLRADPLAIGKHLSADRFLAPIVLRRPGLRVPGAWDGFEVAVRAVLGQQIPVPVARKLAAKLISAYGDPSDTAHTDGLPHTFPTPARLAHADLTKLGMPAARAAALSSLAAAAAADGCLFSPRETLEAAIAKLRALHGIGEWTAQYIAMRALREPDAFPAADIGLMRAISKLEGKRPSASTLLARAEAWRPWRAYAAQHLWTADADIEMSSQPRIPVITEGEVDAPMLVA